MTTFVPRPIVRLEAEFLRALEHAVDRRHEMNASDIDQWKGWLNGTAVRYANFLLKAGYIRTTGKFSPTATGRLARVFGLTPTGLAVLKQYDADNPT